MRRNGTAITGQPGDAGLEPAEELPAYKVARRRTIVEAARHLLDSAEYEQIRMIEVAAAAGVAQATVYRYFSSKEHLYAEVIMEWAFPAEPPRTRADSKLTNADRLERRLIHAFDAYLRHPHLYKAVVTLRGTTDVDARRVMQDFSERANALIRQDLVDMPAGRAKDAAAIAWSTFNALTSEVVAGHMPLTESKRLIVLFVDLIRPRLDQ